MKVRLLATLGILLVTALGVSATGPRLVLEEPEFDFGLIPPGQTVSHVFWLKAAGSIPLQITEVKAGCGCTRAPLEKSELAPGDSTRLEVIFNSRKFSNRVSKTVRILTNEGEKPRIVKISATIENRAESTQPMLIEPRRVELSATGEKDQSNHTFTLTNLTDQRLTLRLVDWPAGIVDLNLPEFLAAGKTVKARATLVHADDNTSFEKSFTIDVGDRPAVRYSVPILCKPPSLSRR